MMYPDIAQRIVDLKNEDLAFRDKLIRQDELEEGYHPDMEAIHIRNAKELEGIIKAVGYPTIAKVGEAASHAAWLIIQHAISLPLFMKMSAEQLAIAVDENQADPKELAYLTDRIAVFEGRPQLYGTSFDWDDNGALSPQPYDDIERVDARRKKLGMNLLSEQTKVIRERAIDENQLPPENIVERSRKYDQWRRDVGWIT